KYISSTAVLMSETLKVVTCFVVLLKMWSSDKQISSKFVPDPLIFIPFSTQMSIPSFLYVVQNNLLFVALSNLDAATYQVTYQMKILTTAFFSVVIMNRSLVKTQWLALVLLTAGVALVQVRCKKLPFRNRYYETELPFEGLIAVFSACLTSGFAGVYLEKIMKQGSVVLWMRNLQL
ncbi:hypothetical protein PMAYCL1PPCAC_08933, partial [Pristionchus mayeri]